MPLSFFKDTVTIKRAKIIKKNGMEYMDWKNASTHDVGGVQIVAQGTTRAFDDRTLQINDRRTLRAAYDADIEPGDRIIWRGVIYEIDGEVFRTNTPTGKVSSTRCTLARWEG